MKIEEVELIETEYKTVKKYMKTGTIRLQHATINVEFKSMFKILETICEKVDCNFVEVLDAVNRTIR